MLRRTFMKLAVAAIAAGLAPARIDLFTAKKRVVVVDSRGGADARTIPEALAMLDDVGEVQVRGGVYGGVFVTVPQNTQLVIKGVAPRGQICPSVRFWAPPLGYRLHRRYPVVVSPYVARTYDLY